MACRKTRESPKEHCDLAAVSRASRIQSLSELLQFTLAYPKAIQPSSTTQELIIYLLCDFESQYQSNGATSASARKKQEFSLHDGAAPAGMLM